ncbi:hypothetical protein GALMADRAFT_220967 [Galerina marginata CBS 339.88]|uniref:ATP-dependent DNA helicase n=1 Tax=Galerina marginata (strain CBS 339.88) TaxID=685588 RepID=A0A067TIM7_GALM3|nr:hypothetical protein GALMADRAFT_220967 [Galerina marginata CBS 339.88]
MLPNDDADYEFGTAGTSSSFVATSPISFYPNLPLTAPNDSKLAVFGHSKFKGKQKEIVEAAYGGADVLVVAPTGMGKSLCFQIPAIADQRGVSVVVSPLLEIDSLRLKNVEVASLSSQVDAFQREEVFYLQSLAAPSFNFSRRPVDTYSLTPERLCNPDFTKILDIVYENHNLNRLVVDEAHCISEWGHDFREEYSRIGRFRTRYPDVPIMALTATATPVVQKDIIKSLKLIDDRLFIALHPFNRENLFYEVRYLSNPNPMNQMEDIFDYITTLYRRRGRSSSGIIYCRQRKTCDDLSSYLRGKGLNSRPYHRGIPSATLDKTLKGWTNGEGVVVDLVVATIAFGLGIDKGDVRYIIHYDVPKSFEGYYQETGRAGRDGHPSKCILYYSREDAVRVQRFVGASSSNRNREEDDGPTPTQRAAGSFESLIKFAESATLCRHVSICRYFGEPIDENDQEIMKMYCNRMCDVCKYPEKTQARITKLSSRQQAIANAPPSRPSSINSVAPPGRQEGFNANEYRRQEGSLSTRASFGAQKRPATDFVESSTKKPKVSLAPLLVTKPYKSATGLSKPFKPPSFVRQVDKAGSSNPPPPLIPRVSRDEPAQKRKESPGTKHEPHNPEPQKAPILKISEIALAEVETDDEETPESSAIELPDVGLYWEVEHSAKASAPDRAKGFESLRRRFHRVFIPGPKSDRYWSKICDMELDEQMRNEIIFKVASELEASVISLSSTLEGYNSKIETQCDDISSLSDLSVWDSSDPNFEDFQEVITALRRRSSARKGKERAR